jgi:hypothetical protein
MKFGLEIRTRTKVMVFQTFEGKCGGKASKIRKSGRKYRAKLIFAWYNIGLLMMWTMKIGLQIRTRTKVMVFQTFKGKMWGKGF